MKKMAVVLTLAVTFCFVLASATQAGPNDPATKGYINNNVKNKKKAASIPTWQITQDGTSKSVTWVDATNPRFAVYDPGTPADTTDDVVLDKETGLIWERNPETLTGDWATVNNWAYNAFFVGRHGWRVPTPEEFGTLGVDNTSDCLPAGHPFIGVFDLSTAYWTQTTDRNNSANALACYCSDAMGWEDFQTGGTPKTSEFRPWFVRGGNGHDAY